MSSSFAYRHSPIWAQELLISAKSSLRSTMREGRAFGAMAAEIHKSEWWSERRLRAFQSEKLQMIAQSAVSNVPYYRNKYRPLDLDFEKLEFPEALAKLPLIGKADVRAAGKSLISERRQGPLFSGSTSGTTGAPLGLSQDLAAINRENAFIWRQLTWAGLRRGDRRAWMRGDMIVPATQEKPPYWRVNRAENMLMLSSYHLSESAAPSYLDSLARFDPVVIQAYPSSIGFLATWMLSTGSCYRGISLRGIVTSSETLSEVRRREIESAIGCRVFDWYDQFERVATIGTCEQGCHHRLSDYSFVGMLVVPSPTFNERTRETLQSNARYRLGDGIALEIQLVDSIPRTRNGKFKGVVCNV